MRKYIGKYRVLCERNLLTGEPTGEDFTYLQSGKMMCYRYNDTELVLYVVGGSIGKANNVIKAMEELGVTITDVSKCDCEADVRFLESDLDKVDSIVKFKTNGATCKPESIRNHPFKDKVKQERLDNMTEEQREKLRLRGEHLKKYLKNVGGENNV